MHERDKKRAKQAIQHIGIYFNHIGRFENELTQLAEPTEQEIRQMREEIEEAKKGKEPRLPPATIQENTGREILKSRREYDRIKAREYRAKKKGAGSRRTVRTIKQNSNNHRGIFRTTGSPFFTPGERSNLLTEKKGTPTPPTKPDGVITTQRNGQTIVAELFFNHNSHRNILATSC